MVLIVWLNYNYCTIGPAFDLNARESIIKRHSPPEILVHGLVTPEDVEKLFEMYVESPPHLLFTLFAIPYNVVSSFYSRLNVRIF